MILQHTVDLSDHTVESLLEQIRAELTANADSDAKASGERFFKEPVCMYGMKLSVARTIANAALKTARAQKLSKQSMLELCEELWRSGMQEEAIIACVFTESLRKSYTPDDFELFERWVSTYVGNWAACDTLCNHTVGDLLSMYPELADRLLAWARSSNRWVRRAAAVSLIVPAKRGEFLPLVLQITDALLDSDDDMVQKGYGWLLKEAATTHEDEVFDYVMQNKAVMPRTALRYAIEKMPENRRQAAMTK